MIHSNKRIGALFSCIAAVLLLAALFIFPNRLAWAFCNDVTALVDDAIADVKREDFAAAEAAMRSIDERFHGVSDTMKLFFDHEDVDELSASIAAATRLVEQRDGAQVMVEFENIRNVVTYLAEIETMGFYNLF